MKNKERLMLMGKAGLQMLTSKMTWRLELTLY